MEALLKRIDEIEEDLEARAFLFDNPRVYRETIDIVLQRVRAVVEHEDERTA